MGPGLSTALQLQGLREAMGTALACRSMWLSATLDPAVLSIMDFRGELSIVELDQEDRAGPLSIRLKAPRTIRRLVLGDGNLAVDTRLFWAADLIAGGLSGKFPTRLPHSGPLKDTGGAKAVAEEVNPALLRTVGGRVSRASAPREDATDLSLPDSFRASRPGDSVSQPEDRLCAVGLVTVAQSTDHVRLPEGIPDIPFVTCRSNFAEWPDLLRLDGRRVRD